MNLEMVRMMHSWFTLPPLHAAFHHEWDLKNITTTFFKCTRWQVEETTDIINCPYHYFCSSTYPGNYSSAVDFAVLLFSLVSYASTAIFTAMEFRRSRTNQKRRYLLPSGPICLPLMLLILSKGYRINTVFPLMHTGPALLQLVHLSALAFQNQVDNSLQYAILEASTVSGILHASLYLDSVILPYYTGLEALTKSTFSGECSTCVCRREALMVGGKLVFYRGWSRTTWAVVGTLCSRMLCRICGGEKVALLIKQMAQVMSWIFIAWDAMYLTIGIPQSGVLSLGIYGGICFLIFLNIFRKVGCFLVWLRRAVYPMKKMKDFNHLDV
ncbi:uncharacterized protein LOC120275362 [Dioscorea cayenensis subsp. rotundata]|uniref:Uncharacterized protein LOC120275362 n=1 Tax=Dioscorea cayennensis subsp. rotundata TaxID=55577 RepID=A0AB40CD55_DIOCR|nr:uncharacterized protein LOC120275362 [Dioscorea cayenensis subsp. rotundata]